MIRRCATDPFSMVVPIVSIVPMVLMAASILAPTSVNAEQPEPRPLFIEGYTHRESYAPGEEIEFRISTSATKHSMRIVRRGGEDELVWEKGDIAGAEHPIPDDASSHGCRWPTTFRLVIPEHWRSGYYHVDLRVEDGGGEFVHQNRRIAEGSLYFIVRSAVPGRDTKILLQLSTNTYNAYTNWGGHSLYGYHARGKLQGHRVSFDRPQRSQFYNWEHPFVRWAERSGYRIDYAANGDLEKGTEFLRHYRLVLSVGHDEYWSAPMRDALEAFIGSGGNVAFFSGNTCCWQIRGEDDGRALVCWKQWYNLDPVYRSDSHATLSTLWSHHLVDRPENSLTGVGFLWGGYHRGRLPPQPRPTHGRTGLLRGPSARSLDLRGDETRAR
jgi:hypothetical protein